MKKFIKKNIIFIVMLLIMFSFCIPKTSFAADTVDIGTMMDQASAFIEKGKTESTSIDAAGMASEFVPLGQLLTTIGMGVMIAVTTYMGIKYLTASPEGQAKLKQQLIGVVVAGIVIFGAYYIWSLVLDIVSQFD